MSSPSFPVLPAACLKLPGSHNLTPLTVAIRVVRVVFKVVFLVAAAEVAVAAAGAGVADGVGVLEVDIQ